VYFLPVVDDDRNFLARYKRMDVDPARIFQSCQELEGSGSNGGCNIAIICSGKVYNRTLIIFKGRGRRASYCYFYSPKSFFRITILLSKKFNGAFPKAVIKIFRNQ